MNKEKKKIKKMSLPCVVEWMDVRFSRMGPTFFFCYQKKNKSLHSQSLKCALSGNVFGLELLYKF